MKFLFAEFRTTEAADVTRGQWVIPAPHLENMFVDVARGETCLVAEVRAGFDPDSVVDSLCTLYPGLPRPLLAHYILRVGVELNKDDKVPPVGTKYRVFCTGASASLQDIRTHDLILLWKDLNLEKYLN